MDAGGHSLKALQFIKKTFPNSLASQGLRVRQGARDRARADPLRCCAVRFFRAAVAAGNQTTPWPYMGQAVPRMKPITQSAAPQRPAHAIFFTIGLLPDGAPERFNCRFESRLGKEVPAPRCLIAHAKHSVSEEIFRRTPCHVRLSTTRRRVELYEVVLETLIDL